MSQDSLFILAVVLLTWGGIFAYMLRLDKLAKLLENEVKGRVAQLDARASAEVREGFESLAQRADSSSPAPR